MRARNPLYVMAKPPPEVQAAIAALPRGDPGRGPDLLHVTLISLYDLHYAPPEWLPATIAALNYGDGCNNPQNHCMMSPSGTVV